MFTLTQIRSWTTKELERRVYALAPDAGGFSVPAVQAIVKKMATHHPDEKDKSYGSR